jgi:hypothetical protein
VSKDFIEKALNSPSIKKATLQQVQLQYFIQSELQDERVDIKYLESWAERKYQTNDYFLNWIKLIFKTENFISFYKYLRYPLPSAKLIKNKIEPQLRRVFNAEDAEFKYDVKGKDFSDYSDDLNIKKFNDDIFSELLYRHNSLIVSDLDSEVLNSPKRYFINIDKVLSIEEKDDAITKIAYNASALIEDKKVDGIIYIDDREYAFFDKKHEPIKSVPHDLGYCPVHFISPKKLNNDFVIRESIYTYVREEIEEYTFLKTLQKMTEANGVVPVVTKLGTDQQKEGQRGPEGQPDSDSIMGSQQAKFMDQNVSVGGGDLQPGTIHEIQQESVMDNEGKINMDIVTRYLTFHYLPVESIKYLNERVNELRVSIISTIVGDFLEGNESAKNEMQIEKSISVLENTLISLAESLNRIRSLSDKDMLGLKYGIKNVNSIFIHYGTDFFLDSQTKLFEDLQKAPNSLERKNIIVRINQNRYKNNTDQLSRQKLLYDLIPYVSDTDFDKAISSIDDITKDYQLRFNFWIGNFESIYGDIVTFYKDLEFEKVEKLTLINNLIIELIKKQIKTEDNENSNPSENEESLQLSEERAS